MEREYAETIEGADYRYRIVGGCAVVARCLAHGSVVKVPKTLGGCHVVAVGEECFASSVRGELSLAAANGDLERVELPSGLTRIGRAAFRGCHRLASVALPDTLEQIGDLAFSCTSISSVSIPRSCVDLAELALRTGPESLEGASAPYLSKIDRIEVEPGNPGFCAKGSVLCRKLGDGRLVAVLCPGKAAVIDLVGVSFVTPTAFAGTYEIGTLRIHEAIVFEGGCGIATNATCESVEIIMRDTDEQGVLRLGMPSRREQRAVLESTKGTEAFDLPSFLAAYDEAVAHETDRLLQAKLMLARLARPVHLSSTQRAAFLRVLEPNFDTLVVQFGARNYWQGFEYMIDAGMLDRKSISHAIDVLASREDTTAVTRLLALKRARLGDEEWDYAL
ncbi:MAG: leucine-rich repeat domain-containing protein [Eggerthellaceae bacterium]|nr:leucine-rich repeat domain-containing protein [Eggerthellaceae bacterium]